MVNPAALPPRTIVTGVSGAGKTTYCRHVIEAARAAQWRVGGILSPARFEHGQKTGIFVQDLQSGAERLLASCVSGEFSDGVRFGKWMFDPAALTWGNHLLSCVTPCDLLVVDEIGPMELERQQGWSACFQAIEHDSAAVILVTLRPSLLEQLQACWPESCVVSLQT